MSEWSGEGGDDPEPRDWTSVKQGLIIGAGCAAAVIAWMMFARPSDEAASSRGFNMGSSGGMPSGSSGRLFESRPKTGLDMVSSQVGSGPPGVDPGIYREGAASPAPSDAPAPPAATPPAGDSAAVPTQASAPPAPASAADEAKDLASAGIPTDAKGLSRLGATEGMLSSLAGKLLDHPKVLRAIFNNKTVVDAFMSRSGAKENCESGGALKAYLSDSKSGGMTRVFPVIQQALSRPGGASGLVSALSDTEMVKRVSSCPSLKALSNDSTAIVGIAMANPKALGLLMDPRGAAALAANPQAAGALAGIQAKMGGAK